MGLENGIILKAKERIKVPRSAKLTKRDILGEHEWFNVALLDYIFEGERVKICYWSSGWGIRDEIMEVLNAPIDGDCLIEIEDIENIIEILSRYMNKHYYNDHHRSIWNYEEMKPALALDLIRLRWCWRLLEEDKIELEFYDSY